MSNEYENTSPKADKLLQPDGSIVTSSGFLVAPPDEERAKVYASMSPQAVKKLLSDGSIDDSNEGGGTGGVVFDGNMKNKKITNLAPGYAEGDAVNFGQLNAALQTAILDSWEGEY